MAKQSFSYHHCTAQEFCDYNDGFHAGSDGLEIDGGRSPAWSSGWNDARETGLYFRWAGRSLVDVIPPAINQMVRMGARTKQDD